MVRWRGARGSANVEDRRGRRRRAGRRAAGGGGLLVLILAIIALFVPEFRPLLQGVIDQQGGPRPAVSDGPGVQDDTREFISVMLAFNEEVWTQVFEEGGVPGGPFRPARLVIFSDAVSTRCGDASSAMGPFYCPLDERIYIDPQFYQVLAQRLDAPGDFAQAYVIAHEMAHHVQLLTGALPDVMRRRAAVSPIEGNRLTVRLELQADCFAGVWAHRIDAQRRIIERGDVNEALRAAHQVGDDVIQRMSGQRVQEDAFTHGRSDQRQKWFLRGFENGDPGRCDTFRPRYEDL